MNSNTILNWNETDHKAIYATQLKKNPVWFNEDINAWVIYSYEHCKSILSNDDAQIPGLPIEDELEERAKLLIANLARLSNDQKHETARQAAIQIFESMKSVSIATQLKHLLKAHKRRDEFDWVAAVAKKLPVFAILKGLGFNDDDCVFVSDNIADLVKIMSPKKTREDVTAINKVINKFYMIVGNHLKSDKFLCAFPIDATEDVLMPFVCNLLGLFIQCYDAGRGLLSNVLLNMVRHHEYKTMGFNEVKRMVVETLRLDPPVHNTRREAVNDIFIGNKSIKAGDAILIVMSAANLDPCMFAEPLTYDVNRANNDQHLTFGLGGHNCLAKYFSMDMAMQVCNFLIDNYNEIQITQNDFRYEPQLNVRLVKQLMVKLS